MSPVQTEQEQADKADRHMNSKKKMAAAACCGMLRLHMLGLDWARAAACHDTRTGVVADCAWSREAPASALLERQ